jgi:hypothetical protein
MRVFLHERIRRDVWNCYNRKVAVGVAQLAEHRTVAPVVAGSIPVSHPRPLPTLLPFAPTFRDGPIVSQVLVYSAALRGSSLSAPGERPLLF